MLFNSIEFLIFFPLVCIFYFVLPHRVRYIYLLACSYFFYMCWNPKYALLMLTSTAITYLSGILIDGCDKISDEHAGTFRKKVFVALSFASNLSILFFFKYFGFVTDAVVRLLSLVNIQVVAPTFDVILPVGISFYTFQALSYTMDVYRKDIYAERNFFKYALFVSFFPQLVAGPIERSKNLLIQINEKHTFSFERMKRGLLLMLFGYFQKVVLSSYLAMVVDSVYNNYQDRTGSQLIVATVCFAFQIYCDFGGYSNIAIGAAQVMGFRIMENFNTPYFSRSVAEFWRRWHISLSTWFRDYLYIPLGGNRKGKRRKHFNLMVVFLLSGLWHGANWHFVAWGGINGIFQVIGENLMPVRKRIYQKLKIDENSTLVKCYKTIITFILIDFSWIFFRADSFKKSLKIIMRMVKFWTPGWIARSDNLANMGLDRSTAGILLVAMAILVVSDILKYRNVRVREWICSRKLPLRWAIYYVSIMFVLIFGVYGPGYNAAEFIYFQF